MNESYRMQNVLGGPHPGSLKDIIYNFKKNFLTRSIEVVPGLSFNQYDIIKRIYFYSHNQFESGPVDDNGDPKYFYDLITDRNDQSTKNIDLDTKDCYIKAETGGSYLKSRLLRQEFMAYAKNTGFGMKLNELCDDLPDFGTVVWKKVKDDDGKADVEQVDLINLINDPVAKCLDDGIVIERLLLSQSELREKENVWGKGAVDSLIATGKTVARNQFMTTGSSNGGQYKNSTVDESTPYYELYEMWGEIPRWLYNKCKTTGDATVKVGGVEISLSPKDPSPLEASTTAAIDDYKTVNVMAIVAGIEVGNIEQVLFCGEVKEEDFPYKEVHYRRRKGRWLGLGNFELCFDLIEKANEITNRYFSSLRVALLHIYQTRDQNHVKNVMTDLLDGDVVVTKSELSALPTEIRGVENYKYELESIERKCDKICNSFEVVSGADLPSGTPFKLGAQQLASATKLFKYIQQNIGLFLEQVFNEWLLPDFAKSLTEEHILELVDDAEDLEMYYTAKRKIYQMEVLKRYILEHNEMPDPAQLALVGDLVKDQISKGPKQVLAEKDYYGKQKYSLKTVITGENDTKKENVETLSTTFQTLAANPAALQDPRLMKILNMLLEETGYSPLDLNSMNQTPTNPALNPANQGGAGAERSMIGNGGAQPQPGATVAPARAAVAAR